MARGRRDIEAGTFHVTAHAVRDTALFRDDVDRVRFLRELTAVTARVGWRCLAYCEMTTHYHLLAEVEDNVLPAAMHCLNFKYACGFNSRHGTRGHVLEARYGAERIMSEAHLLYAYRYIVRNPVAARICKRAQDWPWSIDAGTVGLAEPQPFIDASPVLKAFGHVREFAIARLRDFVDEP